MASDLSSIGRAHIILAEVNHSFPVNLEEARGIHGGSKEEQGEMWVLSIREDGEESR